MGSALSTKSGKSGKKNKHRTSNCNCDLYKEYKHCCSIECLNTTKNNEDTRKELVNTLQQYGLQSIVDIILNYLPSVLEIVPFQNDKASNDAYDNQNYQIFVHSTIVSIYPQLPCSVWIKSKTRSYGRGYDENAIELKCVVLGQGGVGKSALTIRFVVNSFLDEYDPTIEDSYRKQVTINEQKVLFDILDTAGREEFSSMEDQWIREGKFFLLCFALNNQHTFDEAILKRERILRVREDVSDYGLMLVGTKGDLLYDEDWIKMNAKERNPMQFVDREMVIEQAKEWNVPYIETSAKLDKNISFTFEQIFYEWWIQSQAHF